MADRRETTREERRNHVAQMLANFRIESIEPRAEDLELLQQYVEGTKSLDELLAHAREFAAKHAGKR